MSLSTLSQELGWPLPLWDCRGLFGRMWFQHPVSYRRGWPKTYWILGAEPGALGQSGRLRLSHVGLELRHLQELKWGVLSTDPHLLISFQNSLRKVPLSSAPARVCHLPSAQTWWPQPDLDALIPRAVNGWCLKGTRLISPRPCFVTSDNHSRLEETCVTSTQRQPSN